jgi:hypothetical protein
MFLIKMSLISIVGNTYVEKKNCAAERNHIPIPKKNFMKNIQGIDCYLTIARARMTYFEDQQIFLGF